MAITFTTAQLGASPDYKKYLASKITKTDRYKDATLLDFSLTPTDAGFVRLVRGAYITIDSALYPKFFTGYITNEPSLTYLGHNNHVPIWGYVYQATSDEYILNLKPVGVLPTFTNVSMGYIIKQLAARLVPNTFDVSGVQDGPLVAQYTPDSTKKFQDIINEFEESASYRFYANDKKLYFVPQDSATLGAVTIDGNSPHFTPSRLDIRPASSSAAIANDVTVVGAIEPQAYVTEYFVGTGLDAKFPLASGVFGVDASVLLDETFQNSSFDSSKWDVYDTASLWLQIGNGYLNVQGGSGNASFDVRLQSKSLIPLDGKLRLTHGDWRLTSGAGYICGLWKQTPNSSNTGCIYSLYYGSNTIRPVISGVVDDTQVLITNATNRYVIRTVAEFTKTNRITQQYNYLDVDGTVGSYGGDAVADTVVWNTLVSEIDPTGNIVQQVTFYNTATLTNSDVYARYIPAASDTLNAAFSGITISVPLDASLETADKVPLLNPNFEEWPDVGNIAPTGWSTTTPLYIWRESSIVDSGYALKMLGDGASNVEQFVSDFILPNTQYTVIARVRKSATMTGSMLMSLAGTGVTHTLTTAISSLSSSAFQYVVGTITTGISSVPSDLAFRISVSGGATGQALYVDSVQLVSEFTAKLVGPNEMDGLDGVAPIATIVQQSGNDGKSSYLGTPQYNAGQSELVFFKDSTTLTSNVPPANQVIRLRYRSAGPSLGRAINRISAATESVNWGDDGVRSIVRTDIVPTPRTSEECELAAAAVVTENSRTQYEGTYEQWSEYFTQEPKSGASVSFLNLSSMAAVSVEEVNEVVTTIESEKPIERFNHRVSFGKQTASSKLLGKIGAQVIGLQRSAAQAPTTPVDIQAVAANAAYASDVLKPTLLGWAATTVSLDAGEDLTASDLYFEVRYTDDGWGVDDGLNLIARTTSRTFVATRNLRGRTYFIRKARKGNHILWSEDQTNGAVYSGASTKAIEIGPEGQTCNVSSATLSSGGAITGSISGLSGSSFCGSVSVLAPVGKSMRLSLGSTQHNFTATGYWQRVSVSRSGSAPTTLSLSYIGTGSCAVKTTKWSVEESSAETFYAKTAAIKYGPTSRYSSLVRVSFPYDDTAAAADAVAAPTPPLSCTQTVEEVDNTYVITAMLTLPANTGTNTGYNTEFNFYNDSICSDSATGWVGGPDISAADLTQAKTPPWPKIETDMYVRTRARAVNSNNEVSAWVESVAGAGSLINGTGVPGEPTAPTQPTLSDWVISTPSNLMGDYLANANHEQMVRLTPQLINMPTGATFMTFWLYRGATEPSDPAAWEYISDATEVSGEGTWFDQPKTAETWLVCATASKPTYKQLPTTGIATRSISIAAWTRPAAVSGVSVTHSPYVVDGVKWFMATVNYTAPMADPNYFYTAIDSAWVDPITGAWISSGPSQSKWERIYGDRANGPWVSGPHKAYDGGRRYFRIYTVGHEDTLSASNTNAEIPDAVYYLCDREPIADGIDLSYSSSTSLGSGLSKDASGRPSSLIASSGLKNGNFSLPLVSDEHTGWVPSRRASIVGGAVRLDTPGVSPVISSPTWEQYYNHLVQKVPCLPGQAFRITADVENATNGHCRATVIFTNSAGSVTSGEFTTYIASGTGRVPAVVVTDPAPAGTAYILLYGFVTIGDYGGDAAYTKATVGSAWLYSVTLEEITSVTSSGSISVTCPSASVAGPNGINGESTYKLSATWTPVAPTPALSAIRFTYQDAGMSEAPRGDVSTSAGVWNVGPWPSPTSAISATIRWYGLSKDGVQGSLIGSQVVTIAAGAANNLDLSQTKTSTIFGLKLEAGTNRLMPDVSTDFVIDSGTGKLTQSAVDLAKSYGFNTDEFERTPLTNVLRVKTLAVNKLIAGTALFAGDVVFARNNGSGIADSSVTINNAGVVIQKLTSGVVNATVSIEANGVYVTKGTSQVKVEAAGVTITNGILSLSGVDRHSNAITINIDPTNSIKISRTSTSYVTIGGYDVYVKDSALDGVGRTSGLGPGQLNLNAGTTNFVTISTDNVSGGGQASMVFGRADFSAYLEFRVASDGVCKILTNTSGTYIRFSGADSYCDMYAGYKVNGLWVLGSRKAAVASPSGGSVIDVEARVAIDAILNRLGTAGHGLIA